MSRFKFPQIDHNKKKSSNSDKVFPQTIIVFSSELKAATNIWKIGIENKLDLQISAMAPIIIKILVLI